MSVLVQKRMMAIPLYCCVFPSFRAGMKISLTSLFPWVLFLLIRSSLRFVVMIMISLIAFSLVTENTFQPSNEIALSCRSCWQMPIISYLIWGTFKRSLTALKMNCKGQFAIKKSLNCSNIRSVLNIFLLPYVQMRSCLNACSATNFSRFSRMIPIYLRMSSSRTSRRLKWPASQVICSARWWMPMLPLFKIIKISSLKLWLPGP